jgi:hypothetical protein
MEYRIGDSIVFHAEFKLDGEGVDDADVTVKVTKPDGTELAGQSASADGVCAGGYRCTVSAAMRGLYTCKFTADPGEGDLDAPLEVFDYAHVAAWLATDAEVSTFLDGVNQEPFGNFNPIGDLISNTLGSGVYSLPLQQRVKGVVIQAKVHEIYYTIDGTTPTADAGFELQTGKVPLFIPLKSATQLKFLRSASGAILEAQFVR